MAKQSQNPATGEQPAEPALAGPPCLTTRWIMGPGHPDYKQPAQK